MGFQIVDPNAGKFSGRGRAALANTVRISPLDKKRGVLRITISEDLLSSFDLGAGAKINLLIGADDDYGSLIITKTTSTDPLGYTLYKPGKAARAASFVVSANKLYGIKVGKTFDCIIVPNKRGLLIKLPSSILGFGSTNGVSLAASIADHASA